MKRLVLILVAAFLAGVPATLAEQRADLEALYAKAQRQETIAADLAGAISTYAEVVKEAGPTNALTPRALLRMAECHRKLGHAEATAIYSNIVRDYPRSGEPYDTALARLEAIEAQTPPGPLQAKTFKLPVDNWLSYWAISPDGRSAAYFRRGGSQPAPDSDLVLHNLTTGTDRVLASHLRGNTAQVGFSPDGRRVAVAIAQAQTLRHEQLVIAQVAEGAAPPQVLDMSSSFEDAVPAWSPDSRWLPYLGPPVTGANAEVRLLNVETGQSRSLGASVAGRPDFRWSPNGDRLAFRVADAMGVTGAIHLVRPATMAHDIVPAPAEITGQMRILRVVSDGRLVLQRMDQATLNRPGRPASATVGLFDPADGRFSITCRGAMPVVRRRRGEDGSQDECLEVTRDGTRQLFWSAATKRLMIRDLATSTDRPLTVGAAEEHFGLLSPDERVQVFVSNRDGRWSVYAAAIDEAPVSQPAKLAELGSLPAILTPQWSANGLVLGTQGGEANLFRVDMNPQSGHAVGPVVRLTQDQAWNALGTVSPDGTHISYWVTQGQHALAVMDADGSNERLVTPRQFGMARYFAWLSNRDVLLVNTLPDATEVQRLIVNTATGVVTPLSVPLFDNPSWNNAGSNWDLLQPSGEIVYAWSTDKLGPFEFRARSIASGQERSIVSIAATGCELQNFAVAPDAKTLAYQLGPCSDPAKFRTVGVADLETGVARTVIERAGSTGLGGLSSGGRFLAYTVENNDEDAQPWIMDLATRDAWPLMPETQQPGLWTPMVKWAPDNSFIVFMQGQQKREWRQWPDLSRSVIKGGGD